MEKIKQISIFDVLRGILNEGSETLKASVEESAASNYDLTPPTEVYIPPYLRTDVAADGTAISSPIDLPNAPTGKGWWARNWKKVAVVGAVFIGIAIVVYLVKRKRKKDEEEEINQWEYEHSPKPDYPWPSAASSPVVVVEPVRESATVIERYFEELEREERAERERLDANKPPKESEVPQEHEEFKS